MMKKTIIISAHEISPRLGSECSMGWNYVINLAKHHNILLIFARTNQIGSESYLIDVSTELKKEEYKELSIELFPVEQPTINKIIQFFNFLLFKNKAIGNPLLYWPCVKIWEKKVYRVAKQLVKNRKVDIVHHLNHISFREPGFLWKLNIPYVIGPISGFVKVNRNFIIDMTISNKASIIIRNVINDLQIIFSKRLKRALNKASIIYYVSSEDRECLEKYTEKTKLKQLLDIGTSNLIETDDIQTEKVLNTIIWVGRIDKLKALEILLHALKKNELHKNINTVIIGDGPECRNLQLLARKLELQNIFWKGKLDRISVLKELSKAELLIHTSIKEASSAVILEALSLGVPIVCHDAFAAKNILNSSCARKIKLVSRSHSINGFYEVINELIPNKELLSKLSIEALIISKKITWEKLSDVIVNDYNHI